MNKGISTFVWRKSKMSSMLLGKVPNLKFHKVSPLGPEKLPGDNGYTFVLSNGSDVLYMTPFMMNVNGQDVAHIVVHRKDNYVGARGYYLGTQTMDNVMKTLNEFFKEDKDYDIQITDNSINVIEYSDDEKEAAEALLALGAGEMQHTKVRNAVGGGAKKTKTKETVVIDNKKYVVYKGPRGGKYVKRSGKYVPIR